MRETAQYSRKIITLAGVIALHMAAAWALMQHPQPLHANNRAELLVYFISAPSALAHRQIPAGSPAPAAAQPITKQIRTGVRPKKIAMKATVPSPLQKPAPAQLSEQPATLPLPDGPITLSTELAVVCGNRLTPTYPPISKQLQEEGTVVLRVELAANGSVDNVEILHSSGFSRLDDVALLAVKKWHCNPPTSIGKNQRAIALQPFNFQLKR